MLNSNCKIYFLKVICKKRQYFIVDEGYLLCVYIICPRNIALYHLLMLIPPTYHWFHITHHWTLHTTARPRCPRTLARWISQFGRKGLVPFHPSLLSLPFALSFSPFLFLPCFSLLPPRQCEVVKTRIILDRRPKDPRKAGPQVFLREGNESRTFLVPLPRSLLLYEAR